MKKLFLFILLLSIFNLKVDAFEPINVYVFVDKGKYTSHIDTDAIEALKKIDGYNEEFVIVEKEAYVYNEKTKEDDKGKDFQTFKKTVEALNNLGRDYTYTQTPTFIIGKNFIPGYDEDSIKKAIKLTSHSKDEDIVSCVESGNNECIKIPSTKKIMINLKFIIILFLIILCITLIYLVISGTRIKQEKIHS